MSLTTITQYKKLALNYHSTEAKTEETSALPQGYAANAHGFTSQCLQKHIGLHVIHIKQVQLQEHIGATLDLHVRVMVRVSRVRVSEG